MELRDLPTNHTPTSIGWMLFSGSAGATAVAAGSVTAARASAVSRFGASLRRKHSINDIFKKRSVEEVKAIENHMNQ